MYTCLAADPNVVLPEVRLWEYADIEGKDPTRPAIPLNKLLHIVSQQEAAALFAARLAQGASNAGGSSSGGSSSGPLDQGGGTAGTAAAAAGGGGGGYVALDTVVALQPFLLQNWWHTMDGERRGAAGGWMVAVHTPMWRVCDSAHRHMVPHTAQRDI